MTKPLETLFEDRYESTREEAAALLGNKIHALTITDKALRIALENKKVLVFGDNG